MQKKVNKSESAAKSQVVLGYLWGVGALRGTSGALRGSLCRVGRLSPGEYLLLGTEGQEYRERHRDQHRELLPQVLLQPSTPGCYWPSPTERFSWASGTDPG